MVLTDTLIGHRFYLVTQFDGLGTGSPDRCFRQPHLRRIADKDADFMGAYLVL